MTTTELQEELKAEDVLASELAKYAGRWVAVCAHAVIADADTLEALLEQIESKEVEVFKVAEDPNAACFY